MEKFIEMLDDLYDGLRTCLHDMIIFPGTNLTIARQLALAIFIVDIVCSIFDIVHFISWQGSLLAYVLLRLLGWLTSDGSTIIEMDDSEDNDIPVFKTVGTVEKPKPVDLAKVANTASTVKNKLLDTASNTSPTTTVRRARSTGRKTLKEKVSVKETNKNDKQ